MEALGGPVMIAAIVLALAGVQKLADPASTQGALREMGLPWRGPVVPIMAAAEVATGLLVVVVGGRYAALALAAWYLGFAAFVALALRRDVPLASCGCIGKDDTPPTLMHLALDLAFGAMALAVAIDPFGSLTDLLEGQPWAGVPLLGFIALGVYLTYLALAVWPVTMQLAAELRAQPRRHSASGHQA